MPFLFLIFLSGCATIGSLSTSKEIEIRLKGEPGGHSESRYNSSSRILTYSGGQLVRDKTESVEFIVETEIAGADPRTGIMRFDSTTVKKDGPVPLHDLAFPEKNETIEYIVKSTGEILRAGKFNSSSIFFVPSVPIPKPRVRVGDTWGLEHLWRSSRDGVPLRLQVLAILKDIIPCDNGGKCADLEISGHVDLVIPPDAKDGRFTSKVWGRMLFSLERGDVLWSQTRSLEEMSHAKGRTVVNSCMTAELKAGADYKAPRGCEPAEEAVMKVPNL